MEKIINSVRTSSKGCQVETYDKCCEKKMKLRKVTGPCKVNMDMIVASDKIRVEVMIELC